MARQVGLPVCPLLGARWRADLRRARVPELRSASPSPITTSSCLGWLELVNVFSDSTRKHGSVQSWQASATCCLSERAVEIALPVPVMSVTNVFRCWSTFAVPLGALGSTGCVHRVPRQLDAYLPSSPRWTRPWCQCLLGANLRLSSDRGNAKADRVERAARSRPTSVRCASSRRRASLDAMGIRALGVSALVARHLRSLVWRMLLDSPMAFQCGCF